MGNSVEQISGWIAANAERIAAYAADKKARLDDLAKQIDAEQEYALADLRARQNILHEELNRARAAAADHPLEGKYIEREDIRYSRGHGYSRYSKDKTVTLRGVVKIARDWNDMPATNKQTRGHRQPQIGEAFIQRLNAKGEPLAAWELLDKDGGIGRWKVVKEESAA